MEILAILDTNLEWICRLDGQIMFGSQFGCQHVLQFQGDHSNLFLSYSSEGLGFDFYNLVGFWIDAIALLIHYYLSMT